MTTRMRILPLAVITLLALAAPRPAHAQAQVGPEINVGTQDIGFGIGGRVEAGLGALFPTVSELFAIGSFDYYFPSGFNYWEINGNVGYRFQIANANIKPYAGAGLVIAHAGASNCVAGICGSASSTDVGLNLLAGTNFPKLGTVTPFVELHIELRSGSLVVFTGGVLF